MMTWINRVSHLFQPSVVIPKCDKDISRLSKSYQLMKNAGIIGNVSTGMYAFLPLGLKALQKLINIVDDEMKLIGGQKVLLPVLTASSLWAQTSRLEEAKSELFMLRDRHGKEYLLSPTFEEAITSLIAQLGPLKRNQLPLRLYQTSRKWRDEIKPRLGLLRSREFIMKDMYTFDVDAREAEYTYEIVNNAYDKILKNIDIPYVRVIADSGLIGGTISHEYHYISDIGEDIISICKVCNYYNDKTGVYKISCPSCSTILDEYHSVEIGHTFLLGTKYTKSLKATFMDNLNKKQLLIMGCYGLGLTRIIATAIEIKSTNLEIRWPLKIAPYSVCIIPPKAGSKEDTISQLAYDLYFDLEKHNIDVIMDDRVNMTIGRRFIEARKCGYPFVIIVGKKCLAQNIFMELHNVYNGTSEELPPGNVTGYLKCYLENS